LNEIGGMELINRYPIKEAEDEVLIEATGENVRVFHTVDAAVKGAATVW